MRVCAGVCEGKGQAPERIRIVLIGCALKEAGHAQQFVLS